MKYKKYRKLMTLKMIHTSKISHQRIWKILYL